MPDQSYAAAMSVLKGAMENPESLARVYLLFGSDDSLKREVLQRLYAVGLDPSFSDFDREVADFGPGSSVPSGESDPVRRIIGAVSLAPFASPRRVVLAASVQRLTKDRQVALAEVLPSLPATALLILYADASDVEAGRPKGRQVENVLKKAAAVHGVAVNCETPNQSDLLQRARAEFQLQGKTTDDNVYAALASYASMVASTGGSGAVAVLKQEITKAVLYTGTRDHVTRQDVELLLPDVAEESIFRLLDAVGSKNAAEALRLFGEMLSAGERPDGVAARTLVMLQRHIRLLMLAKYAADRRLSPKGGVPEEVRDMLSTEMNNVLAGQAYRIPAYQRQAALFSWDDLVMASSGILAADMTMKGIRLPRSLKIHVSASSDNPVGLMNTLIAELSRKPGSLQARPAPGLRPSAGR